MVNKPSERTLRRARKNPTSATVSTLYALAKEKGVPMEEAAGLPMFFYGRQIDGYVINKGYIYFYRKRLPTIPPRNSYYVYEDNDGIIRIARRDYVRTYKRLIGICVFLMRILPADDFKKTNNLLTGMLTEFNNET